MMRRMHAVMMDLILGLMAWLVFILSLPLWIPCWFLLRMTAPRCPRCNSKWLTTLHGEWNGEDWHCHACGLWWVRGPEPKR